MALVNLALIAGMETGKASSCSTDGDENNRESFSLGLHI
jgi:hypothetical protein